VQRIEFDLRGDLLLGVIKLGSGVTFVGSLSDTVDLVVDRSTVMVSVLTSTGNGPLDVRWMPCTDTGNLSETFVCFSRKLLGTPSAGDTRESVTLSDSNDIDHLILLEDGADLNWLLEKTLSERDLILNATTVDLDFHQVCLLLLQRSLADLSVGENTDNGAVLGNASELTVDLVLPVGILLGVLGEGLLLGLVPVLVESALELVAQMLSPNSGEGTQTTWSLDITN
jgi:hypothetical protein